MPSSVKHILASPYPLYSHTRILVDICGHLVTLQPDVTFTILTTNDHFKALNTEHILSFEGNEALANRVRLVSMGDVTVQQITAYNQAFAEQWTSLFERGELLCKETGTRYTDLAKPQAIILDFFATDEFKFIKQSTGDDVKVYVWYPGPAYSFFPMWGPVHLGGPANTLRIMAEEEAARSGQTFDQVVEAIMSAPPPLKATKYPGLPEMYQHENVVQEWDIKIFNVIPYVHDYVLGADGMLLFTPQNLEPEATAVLRDWYSETGKPVYYCGPFTPRASNDTALATVRLLHDKDAEFQNFLDKTLTTHGEKSLLYFSFGTVVWPVDPAGVFAFIDVVMELEIPFIMSYPTAAATVPDSFKEKVKAYGRGILSRWAPQRLIYNHPVTGWSVTHGGFGGVLEAVNAGVPQIFWPFVGDQAVTAIHFSENLNMGYELIEVRTGPGLLPIRRKGDYTAKGTIEALQAEARDVLKKAFGEDGTRKRDRLQNVRKAISGEWQAEGGSHKDMMKFLNTLI